MERIEKEPIVSLHEKSNKPKSGKKKKKPGSLATFHGRPVTPNSGKKEKTRMRLALYGGKIEKEKKIKGNKL